MSADMKAATEIAERNRYANTTFGDLSNAFLELAEESRRWENVFDAQTSELRELRQQVEQERKSTHALLVEKELRNAELSGLLIKERRERAFDNAAWQRDNERLKTAEQRAAELQARLDRVEAALRELVEAEWMVSHDWGGDRHSVLDKAVAALAAAGGQESAAVEDKR